MAYANAGCVTTHCVEVPVIKFYEIHGQELTFSFAKHTNTTNNLSRRIMQNLFCINHA